MSSTQDDAQAKQVAARVLEAAAAVNEQARQATFERLQSACVQRCLGDRAPRESKLVDSQRRCLEACASAFLETHETAAGARASIMRTRPGGEGGGDE